MLIDLSFELEVFRENKNRKISQFMGRSKLVFLTVDLSGALKDPLAGNNCSLYFKRHEMLG